MTEKPHKKLIVWQKAMQFIETIYRVTEQFPDEERFGLVSQMRRAAISIASNIAEGVARQTIKERVQFLFIARGSVSELDTQLEIAHRLRFIKEEQRSTLMEDLEEVSRLLNGLINSQWGRAAASAHSLTPLLPH